jgi:hypothetical protein
MQQVGNSAKLRVDHKHSRKGDEIEQITTPTAEDQRGQEQDEQVPLRRQSEPEQPDGQTERRDQHAHREHRRRAGEVWTRRAPFIGGLAIGLAIFVRIPFWRAPLTADEAGYAEVARLWDRGATLYDGVWVDRPQGLVLIFRAIHLLGGSALAMRITAAAVATLVVAATMLLALRLARGRITPAVAGLLAATIGASPFLESFTLSGELLASLPALLSLLAFCAYLDRRRACWLIGAGLLTGCAVLVKQSAFDAGLAAVAYLLWSERRRGVGPAGLLATSALAPVALAAAAAASFGEWWYAVVGYRFQGDSLLTGSTSARMHLLWLSLPTAGKALGLLAVLAAVGWRQAPLLARLWFAAALVGVLGGGNFHPHYYIQLVPPLSLLAAVGLRYIWGTRNRPAFSAAAAGAAATMALALPAAWASPGSQAREIWPRDPHLVHDAALARYIRVHTRPHERILVVWANANIYYLADRPPATPYLWFRNVESIPGAVAAARKALAERHASLVAVVQPPNRLDRTGRTARILRRYYHLAARVHGVAVYRGKTTRKTPEDDARQGEVSREAQVERQGDDTR